MIIATIKKWNIDNAKKLREKSKGKHEIHILTKQDELTYDTVKQIQPQYIFFPHWSWIIPEIIFREFPCIVFHMTDLPFGRGGSPLQNLIERGIENTKISAIRVDGGIDTGDIYLKEDLNLNGTAEEIFMRASNTIFDKMIPTLLEKKILPYKQQGEVVHFKRRKPEDSEIKEDIDFKKIYDYIRMLDAEGYPKAFIQFGKYKLQFSRASLKNGKIIADVEILEEDKDE